MRFTAMSDMPPSELVRSYEDTAEVCRYFAQLQEPFGFDTETSGLDFDGLLVDVHVVCLASRTRRVAILTSGTERANLGPVLQMLKDTPQHHCGYNIIYDWNALTGDTTYKRKLASPFKAVSCFADGMRLFNHFDEEGEETYGARGLKARARHWLGLPMNSFDKAIQAGEIRTALLADDNVLALDYCTRDAWAHLGICLRGREITLQMPWCMECPECGRLAFHVARTNEHVCPEHGAVEGKMLSIWDMHTRLDIPFLRTLHRMQIRGLPMDWGYLERVEAPLEIAAANAYKAFLEEVNTALSALEGRPVQVTVSANSPDQIRQLYYGTYDAAGNRVGFGFPARGKTKAGRTATGRDHLRKLLVEHQAPGILRLLEYRDIVKMRQTYVIGLRERKFPVDGRVHGSLRPDTRTGRLSSSNPNMQNFPTRDLLVDLPPSLPLPSEEELVDAGAHPEMVESLLEALRDEPEYRATRMKVNIRTAVRAPQGYVIICVDYAQLEIRLTALDSGCDALSKVINEGVDMHCYAAAKAFAAGIPGLGYDDLYEAKAWGEGEKEPRLHTLRKAAEGTDFLKPRWANASVAALQAFHTALEGAAQALRSLPEGATWKEAVLQVPGLDDLAAAIGKRDKELVNLRKAAKSAIFGIIYGIGAAKLAAQIMEATKQPFTAEAAKELIRSIKEDIFPGIGRMIARQQYQLRTRGYVRTAMGRYRHPAGIHSGDHGRRAQAIRQSSNSPIQGLAADIVQIAMLNIEECSVLRELGVEMLSQIHDELLFLCPEENAEAALQQIRYLMENTHGLVTPVPITVSGRAAPTWDEAK